jgi:hypothetical protein
MVLQELLESLAFLSLYCWGFVPDFKREETVTSGLWDLEKTPVRISTLDALLENYPIKKIEICC